MPHFNSVLNYLDDASVTPILRDLIVQSSLPLKAVEVDGTELPGGRSLRRQGIRQRQERRHHHCSKSDVAMVSEVLAKMLCHNLVVLIHEMYELGIDPIFWAGTPLAQLGRG